MPSAWCDSSESACCVSLWCARKKCANIIDNDKTSAGRGKYLLCQLILS
ncbi:hypothetical protein HMPREF1548_01888 [Clostridium sp. KLE 1755]|nr:hypothetical protein HMPREF1548_01888 [Clostridium sp. KLE 1755]